MHVSWLLRITYGYENHGGFLLIVYSKNRSMFRPVIFADIRISYIFHLRYRQIMIIIITDNDNSSGKTLSLREKLTLEK